MNVKDTIISFIDKIFQPPISFLDLAIEKLQQARLVAAQGLNVGQYLSVLGDLPFAYQALVASILIGTVLLGTLLVFRSIMRLYYATKEGVKWW